VLAALLAAGPSAVVSHRAAAHLLGFDGFEEGRVEIVVPRGRRLVVPVWARLHTATQLNRLDVIRMQPFVLTGGEPDAVVATLRRHLVPRFCEQIRRIVPDSRT
jgi:hypothetical protein